MYSFLANLQDRLGPLLLQGGQKGEHPRHDAGAGWKEEPARYLARDGQSLSRSCRKMRQLPIPR